MKAEQVGVGLDRLKDRFPVELPHVVLAKGHHRETVGQCAESDLVTHHVGVGVEDLSLRAHLTHHSDHRQPACAGRPQPLLPEVESPLLSRARAPRDGHQPPFLDCRVNVDSLGSQGLDVGGNDIVVSDEEARLAGAADGDAAAAVVLEADRCGLGLCGSGLGGAFAWTVEAAAAT